MILNKNNTEVRRNLRRSEEILTLEARPEKNVGRKDKNREDSTFLETERESKRCSKSRK